ncbi:hypothetical protein scyTo_0018787 [Scyliorhinus torazame]|uniref:Uncharacterized protein n=1 Tax=Scyliorhinus torazame TaxID=75743 RepID=A0A401Q2R7_SCYTO|nr:hypothetical protein [Scyliorhinus torazame]
MDYSHSLARIALDPGSNRQSYECLRTYPVCVLPPQGKSSKTAKRGSPDLPQAAGEGNGSEEIVYATLKVNGGPTAKYKAEPADNSVLYAAVKFRPEAD